MTARSINTFLSYPNLWEKILEISKSKKRIDAAIAYFGGGGAELLRLKRGDRLIVDINPNSTSTDPFEIEKLIKRGVKVFYRKSLHAKIIITDNQVLVGSANISNNSKRYLDEAAIFSNDPIIVNRAQDFFEKIASVSKTVSLKYLKKCKEIYQNQKPNFNGRSKELLNQKLPQQKLWIVRLDGFFDPDLESEEFKQSKDKAKLIAKNPDCLNYFWFYKKPKMAQELEAKDQIIIIQRMENNKFLVYPPAKFIFYESREDYKGKERYLFHYEEQKNSKKMSWENFQKELNNILDKKVLKPCTMPIREIQQADGLLRLWY
jgi:hypothetical protein